MRRVTSLSRSPRKELFVGELIEWRGKEIYPITISDVDVESIVCCNTEQGLPAAYNSTWSSRIRLTPLSLVNETPSGRQQLAKRSAQRCSLFNAPHSKIQTSRP